MVMVANGDAESLFGLVLLNNEAVQMPLDVARGELKFEDRMRLLLRLIGALDGARLCRRCKACAEKFLQALLQLLGSGRIWLAHGFCLSVMADSLARGRMRYVARTAGVKGFSDSRPW